MNRIDYFGHFLFVHLFVCFVRGRRAMPQCSVEVREPHSGVVLPFHRVGSVDQNRAVTSDSKRPYPLSYLAGSELQIVFWLLFLFCGMCTHTDTHMLINVNMYGQNGRWTCGFKCNWTRDIQWLQMFLALKEVPFAEVWHDIKEHPQWPERSTKHASLFQFHISLRSYFLHIRQQK